MNILGSQALMDEVRKKDLCTTCGACVAICPYHQAHNGKIAQVFDCDLTQGQCYAYCPKTENDLESLSQTLFGTDFEQLPVGFHRNIVAARAGEKTGPATFQNGGTVSALISAALDLGLIESAVLTGHNGIHPSPKLVGTPEEVLQCTKTKYMASATLARLNEAIKEGKKRLGVVGTGCQMTATANMRTNPLNREEYQNAISLSVGVFCTWSLKTGGLLDLIKKHLDLENVISMDVPPPPANVFLIKTKTGDVQIPLDEVRPLIPEGCLSCPDMTAEWSDLSVGAFEGNPGWNTLIVRSSTGESLVDFAQKEGYLVLEPFPEDSKQHLIDASLNKKNRSGN